MIRRIGGRWFTLLRHDGVHGMKSGEGDGGQHTTAIRTEQGLESGTSGRQVIGCCCSGCSRCRGRV